MFSKAQVARCGVGLAVVLFAVTGCRQGPPASSQGAPDSATKMATERDRLLAEVAENARLMSEIGVDLARVRIPSRAIKVSNESPLGASRDSIAQKIKYVTMRINESERKLRDSEQRIQSLSTLSDSLRATLLATIQNYDSLLSQQKATIAA